jgi:hypothetical protein
MLPALTPGRMSLADVIPSSILALSGQGNPLGLPAVDLVIVVLVDGLGAEALAARAGHARTLAGRLAKKSVIESGFPTTTASAIATLTTGTRPGQHGLVGYTVCDTANDRVINQLSGWDSRMDPVTWQRMPTQFERLAAAGRASAAIGPNRYSSSGFTRAVLRGALYESAASIADRMRRAAELCAAPDGPVLSYVYVPELDVAAHAHGWQSPQWTAALESLDSAVAELASDLAPRHGLLITADHGIVDVPQHSHVLFDTVPELIRGVRFVAGDPRCLQLHFEEDLSESGRSDLVSAWRSSESERSWIATREEAIGAGWFGDVDPVVEPRIGDVVIAARKTIAYYDSRRENDHGRSMIGQHGSWSSSELRIPLLRLGAFASS